MAGVAHGDPANVTIDAKGYLHLRIVHHKGKWTAAEVFTTDRIGFGTYQWVIEGNVYDMDPTTVLGLFTYGPTHHFGGDAENEIDIEFSQWNKTCHDCNADFTVYPSTGNRKPKGESAWEDNFHVTGGTSPPRGSMVPRPHRFYADGWRSPGRNHRRRHQDRNLYVRGDEHPASRHTGRHQFLVLQAHAREESVRNDSRFSVRAARGISKQAVTSDRRAPDPHRLPQDRRTFSAPDTSGSGSAALHRFPPIMAFNSSAFTPALLSKWLLVMT